MVAAITYTYEIFGMPATNIIVVFLENNAIITVFSIFCMLLHVKVPQIQSDTCKNFMKGDCLLISILQYPAVLLLVETAKL